MTGNASGRGSSFAGGSMNLDVNTLFLVTIYVEAILGLLLLFAWVQNTQISAVAWWGCAHLLRAGSIVLFGLYGNVTEAVSIDLANALLFLSFAVTWSGARVFDGRPPLPMYIAAGPVAWLIVAHLPSFAGDLELRPALLRDRDLLHLAHRARVLVRPERAPGVALAGYLHVVRAQVALSSLHAACSRAALGAQR